MSDKPDPQDQALQDWALGEAADIVLAASRVLLGIADRSLPDAADVTLRQMRALVVLEVHTELNVNGLAELLGVSASTATRMCDRLVRKRLIRRRHARASRREVCISLSPAGAALVAEVVARRRAAIAEILAKMPPAARDGVAESLDAFLLASGEDPGPGRSPL